MNKVIIFDALFSTKSFQNIHVGPSYFEWVRPDKLDMFASLNNELPISAVRERRMRRNYKYNLKIEFVDKKSPLFFSEQFLLHSKFVNSDNKISILLEPKELHPENYSNIKLVEDNFKYILTHNIELILTNPKKYLYYPFGGSWINPSYIKLYNKDKNISACFSDKNTMEGHILRYDIYSKLKDTNKCDFYGNICGNHIYDKVDAIKDYRFHFAIENIKANDFFTEKLIDCFLLGTMPIYWGTENIPHYFDANGMIIVNNIDDIMKILPKLNEDYYMDRINYIERNFELAKQFIVPEDWIYKKYPFLFNEL